MRCATKRDCMCSSAARTNIGRTIDVYKTDGPSRRNDLAFTEDNEINRTVSREHAHILFSKKTGEYRLFNDRWRKPGNKSDTGCGVWIIRDGISQAVHHNTRGTAIKSGDEIEISRPLGRKQRIVVYAVADKHIARKDARALYEDLTPPPTAEEIEQRRIDRLARAFMRPQSAGSPDKRERRQLRRMKEGKE